MVNESNEFCKATFLGALALHISISSSSIVLDSTLESKFILDFYQLEILSPG